MADPDHTARRVCNTCGESKTLDGYELRPTKSNPEYRRPMCNACKNRRKKEAIKADPERQERQRAWDRKYWEQNREAIGARRRSDSKRKASDKRRQDKLRTDMTPTYIAVRLRLPVSMVTAPLAEAKRTNLLIKRFIWGRTK